MSIWILALVLCALFAAIGYFSGAVRTVMMYVGVVVAIFITGVAAPKFVGLMPKIGIKHPLWIQMAPYIIVFSLLALIVYSIGFAIHHKVAMIYKYQRDDYSRLKWERMNHHVGLAIGLFIALHIFFVTARVAYAGGYLTAQVAEDKNNPAWINFLTAVREDMKTTGLDKAVAALDKTSPKFYEAADIIGLIYHNPSLQSRLANYPYFLSTGQRAEFQELAADKDYNELIFGRSSFGAIINHPNTQRLLANQEILAEVTAVDMKDLRTYLETGKSPKYDDEKILGRWILDKDSVLTYVRKNRPDIKANDLLAVKKGIEMLPAITLINTLEKKSIVKAEAGGAAAAAPAAEAAPAPTPAPDPSLDRYNRMRGTPRPPAAPAQAAKPAPAPQQPPVLQIAGEGEWKPGAAGGYEITVTDQAGKPQTLAAAITDDEMTLSKGGLALIFVRAE